MITDTVGFLTLFTWIISTGSSFGLDQPTEFCQDEHYKKNETFSMSCKYSLIHDSYKTKPTLAFNRSSEMDIAFDKSLACKRCTLSLLCMLFDSYFYLLQKAKNNMNAKVENREMCKGPVLQFGVHFLSKTDCLLHKMECDLKDKILKDFRSGFLKYQILRMIGSQMSHVSSNVSKRVYLRVGCGKILSTSCSKEECMIQAGNITCPIKKSQFLLFPASVYQSTTLVFYRNVQISCLYKIMGCTFSLQ
ncbi:hypothetical protein ILYODFUR_012925 [Ilyodon furcidens]|uniref:Uncharacterized protein n=1 Tax=Ilyodon furcidens TaxID=33524 RepID=A0ABV0VF47_9TELE